MGEGVIEPDRWTLLGVSALEEEIKVDDTASKGPVAASHIAVPELEVTLAGQRNGIGQRAVQHLHRAVGRS